MVTGNSIYPINPVRCVAMCIVKFLFFTEQGFSEFLDILSIKETYPFSFDRK